MKEDDDDIQEYVSYREAFPKEKFMIPVDRNEVLEEVAKEFEKMTAFEKDTMASFAAFVRGMKK
jgi:hypothetical protein